MEPILCILRTLSSTTATGSLDCCLNSSTEARLSSSIFNLRCSFILKNYPGDASVASLQVSKMRFLYGDAKCCVFTGCLCVYMETQSVASLQVSKMRFLYGDAKCCVFTGKLCVYMETQSIASLQDAYVFIWRRKCCVSTGCLRHHQLTSCIPMAHSLF